LPESEVHYRFLSLIGSGGFGKVYRARVETADGFQRDVAIKVLNDPNPPKSLLQRFRDEAKILGLVRDRAIVGVEPPIRIGEQWAVVMEFVDGVSAGALVDKGPLPPGVAVEVVGEVARALHNAFHMEGPEGGPLQLLHRDIKPDNIQVTPNGDVRLLDFGVARANFAKREFHTRQSLGGTPGYIAPERLHRIEVPEGDVYSLGVVLHELVTGNRPRFSPTVHLGGQTVFEPIVVAGAGVSVDPGGLEVD
jgi:serine/threonine protein kinase